MVIDKTLFAIKVMISQIAFLIINRYHKSKYIALYISVVNQIINFLWYYKIMAILSNNT